MGKKKETITDSLSLVWGNELPPSSDWRKLPRLPLTFERIQQKNDDLYKMDLWPLRLVASRAESKKNCLVIAVIHDQLNWGEVFIIELTSDLKEVIKITKPTVVPTKNVIEQEKLVTYGALLVRALLRIDP